MNQSTRSFKDKIKFYFNDQLPTLFEKDNRKITLINTIVASIHPIMSVLILKYILDMIYIENTTYKDIILASFIYTILFILLSVTNNILRNKSIEYIINKRITLFQKISHKIMKMDYEKFESPEFMLNVQKAFSGIAGESQGLQQIYNESFELLPNIVIFIVFSIILFKQSPFIILVVISNIIINIFISNKISDNKYKYRDELSDDERKIEVYKNITTDFSYGKDIRMYKLKKRLFDNLNKFILGLKNTYKKIFLFNFKISFLKNLTITLADFVSFLILTYLTINNYIKLPDLVMLLSLIVVYSNITNALIQSSQNIIESIPSVMDSLEFYRSDLNMNTNNKDIRFNGPVNIRFEEVSYRYSGADRNVFENLSFSINKGETVAIIGVNGAGKTTIIKLLTGLLKPSSGKIFIDNVDISTLSDESLFRVFSAVFQEVEPVALTIAENIAVDDENIDYDKVVSCLKTVGLWEKVKELDNSYNSNLLKVIYDDGVILSGGENQKLAIARALYKDYASVMIMDEPTSALDAIAEEKIYKDFDNYMGNKTGIFISHRLASTKFCDKILFLDGGEINSIGTHENLLKNNTKYRDMYEAQAKYYRPAIKCQEKIKNNSS